MEVELVGLRTPGILPGRGLWNVSLLSNLGYELVLFVCFLFGFFFCCAVFSIKAIGSIEYELKPSKQ